MLILFALLFSSTGAALAEVFSSTHAVGNLIETETQVVHALNEYLEKQFNALRNLERYVGFTQFVNQGRSQEGGRETLS